MGAGLRSKGLEEAKVLNKLFYEALYQKTYFLKVVDKKFTVTLRYWENILIKVYGYIDNFLYID